ncbi:MAG: hypothetical protein H6925_04140 [Holosporaceae bacterium]|nr:MAG: hypothetical protein H6925_04140 [Holosporaceae bacterium]
MLFLKTNNDNVFIGTEGACKSTSPVVGLAHKNWGAFQKQPFTVRAVIVGRAKGRYTGALVREEASQRLQSLSQGTGRFFQVFDQGFQVG